MKKKKLEKIFKKIDKHQHWLKEDCQGWEKMRADFTNADLSYVDFGNANLTGAIFNNAILNYTCFTGADLRFAEFFNADMFASFISDCDCSYADFRGARLYNTRFYCSNIDKACFKYANITSTDFSYAENTATASDLYFPYACPSEGSFIGYKKVKNAKAIVKLEILHDAKRCSATSRKCRCDKARVLEIYDYEHKSLLDTTKVMSDYDSNFVYEIGKIVRVNDFDENRWNECSTGIHFFLNFDEAIDY